MNKVLKIFTYIMFIITILITLLYLIALAIFIFDEPYIFPIIFFTIFDILLILYCIYYFNCIKYLRNKDSLKEKTIKTLKTQSQVGIVIHGYLSFIILIILLGSTLFFQRFFNEQLFFLIPLIITLLYTINHFFLEKNIQ